MNAISTIPVGAYRTEGRRRTYSRADLDELERLARFLDAQWRIPGLGIRFGADALVGLVPGIGDMAVGAVGTYIIYRAWRMGVPVTTLAMMGLNIAFDTVVGSIPVAGTVFDIFYRANIRNMRLLRRHLERNMERP